MLSVFPTFTNPTGHLHPQVVEACTFWSPCKLSFSEVSPPGFSSRCSREPLTRAFCSPNYSPFPPALAQWSICLSWAFHTKGVICCVLFCVWHLSLNMMFSTSIHVVAYISTWLLFMAKYLFHCLDIARFLYPFVFWFVFGLYPLFGDYEYNAMNIHVHVFCGDICIRFSWVQT